MARGFQTGSLFAQSFLWPLREKDALPRHNLFFFFSRSLGHRLTLVRPLLHVIHARIGYSCLADFSKGGRRRTACLRRFGEAEAAGDLEEGGDQEEIYCSAAPRNLPIMDT